MSYLMFNSDMTEAIQNNLKTMTRRLMKQPPEGFEYRNMQGFDKLCALFDNGSNKDYKFHCIKSPFKVGQIYWIREPAKVIDHSKLYMTIEYTSDKSQKTIRIPDRFLDLYKKDGETIKTWQPKAKWILKNQKVPNGCFKEIARTYIIITGISVERLNNISNEDAKNEGIKPMYDKTLTEETFYPRYDLKELFPYFKENEAVKSFKSLWESINGKGSFNNQWIWVINFKVVPEEYVKSKLEM